jgi:hypothetical protein
MLEQAKSARVTGTVGALVLVIAVAMMVVASPSRPHLDPAGPAAFPAHTVSQVIQMQTAGPGIRP